MNNIDSSSFNLPWHDYLPGAHGIPHHVRFLRVGFIQYQQLLRMGENATDDETTITMMELAESTCRAHPNLQQVQIYLPVVSRIGNYALSNCRRLQQVEFLMKQPREQGEDQREEEATNVPPSQLVSIGLFAFGRSRRLQSVIGLEHARDSLQEIGNGVFYECRSLVNVDFFSPLSGLKRLGKGAFCYNTMTTVDFSKLVEITELSYTFSGCAALISVHLPPSLLRVRKNTFANCSSLEQIHFPPRLQSIGKVAFQNCCKLKDIVLPSVLNKVGRRCFYNCNKLTHVVLPSTRLPFLKKRLFNQTCTSLSSLVLPNPVPRQQWPLILEQFCREDGIARIQGGIEDPKNRNTIVWNFLCCNMALLFIEDYPAAMMRRRPAPQLS